MSLYKISQCDCHNFHEHIFWGHNATYSIAINRQFADVSTKPLTWKIFVNIKRQICSQWLLYLSALYLRRSVRIPGCSRFLPWTMDPLSPTLLDSHVVANWSALVHRIELPLHMVTNFLYPCTHGFKVFCIHAQLSDICINRRLIRVGVGQAVRKSFAEIISNFDHLLYFIFLSRNDNYTNNMLYYKPTAFKSIWMTLSYAIYFEPPILHNVHILLPWEIHTEYNTLNDLCAHQNMNHNK